VHKRFLVILYYTNCWHRLINENARRHPSQQRITTPRIPIGYNGMPHIYSQNCPFPFNHLHPHLMHPSIDRPHSSPQTTSRSNQPLCHNTPSGHTDRPTDRQTDITTHGIGDRSILRAAYGWWWATRLTIYPLSGLREKVLIVAHADSGKECVSNSSWAVDIGRNDK